MFPRQLLCQHFWSLQQRTEFAMEGLRRQLYNYKPVFRCVQSQLDTLKGRQEYEHWAYVLGLLGSGMHPKPEDIIKSVDLFRGDPYHFSYLYPGHVVKHSIFLINTDKIYQEYDEMKNITLNAWLGC